jgi:ribosomal protein S18 acetylase RimI-like enzyme
MARMIGTRPSVTLGGFVGDALAGSIALIVSPRLKQRHKGHVVAVYVAPPWRGTGLARALLDRLIAEARGCGLIQLTLSVTVGNEAAKRLYIAAGFSVCGVEPLSLRVGSALLDEELMVMKLA